MQLEMTSELGSAFKSRSQMARVITEEWAVKNQYCPACDNNSILQSPTNNPSIDFICERCQESYQLKSGSKWSETRVPDAGYEAMMKTISSGSAPNLLVMQYTPDWTVQNLLLVPSFFFTASAIEKRKPLSPTAVRAHWVGCNILLSAIAPEGKLRIITDGVPANPIQVRSWYQRVRPLSNIPIGMRGWTLDVLKLVRSLNQEYFTLSDVYTLETHLQVLHPNNNNISLKIRQQLQILRDLNLIQFLGAGKYQLVSPSDVIR